MAEATMIGTFQLDNGMWGYRYTLTYNGKKKDVKKQKDELGRPFKTEKAAFRARESAMLRDRMSRIKKTTAKRMTLAEVYQEYCEMGRNSKVYVTIKKQDSLWRNHLAEKFGDRFIDEISVAEVNDYLAHLYYTEGRAYKYVEGFLKMFYLIFGQAYSRNYLDVDIYNKLCVMKEARISMPKLKNDEVDCSKSDIVEAANLIFNMLVNADKSPIVRDFKKQRVPNIYDGGYHYEIIYAPERLEKIDF